MPSERKKIGVHRRGPESKILDASTASPRDRDEHVRIMHNVLQSQEAKILLSAVSTKEKQERIR